MNQRLTVSVRLEARLRDQLQKEADRDHRKLANLIEKVLIEYCEGRPHKPINGAEHRAPKTRATV